MSIQQATHMVQNILNAWAAEHQAPPSDDVRVVENWMSANPDSNYKEAVEIFIRSRRSA